MTKNLYMAEMKSKYVTGVTPNTLYWQVLNRRAHYKWDTDYKKGQLWLPECSIEYLPLYFPQFIVVSKTYCFITTGKYLTWKWTWNSVGILGQCKARPFNFHRIFCLFLGLFLSVPQHIMLPSLLIWIFWPQSKIYWSSFNLFLGMCTTNLKTRALISRLATHPKNKF